MPGAPRIQRVHATPSPERTRHLLQLAEEVGGPVAFVTSSSGSLEAGRAHLERLDLDGTFLGDPVAFALHLARTHLHEWVPSGLLIPYSERRALLREAAVDVERRARERAGLELRALLKRTYAGGADGGDVVLDAFDHGKRTGLHPMDFIPHAYPLLRDVRGLLDTLQHTYESLKRPKLDDADLLQRVRNVLRTDEDAVAAARNAYPTVVVDAAEDLLPEDADLLQQLQPMNLIVGTDPAARTAWHPADPPTLADIGDAQVADLPLARAPHAIAVAQHLVPDLAATATGEARGLPPRAVPAASDRMEVRLVATAVNESLRRRVRPSDVAILHRGANPPATLTETLRKNNIPHTTVDAAGDPTAPEVRLLAAYLHWMANEKFRYERRNPTHRGILETLLQAHDGVTPDAASRFTGGLADASRAGAQEAVERALGAADDAAVTAAWEHLRAHRTRLRPRLSSLDVVARAREAAGFAAESPARSDWDLRHLERLARHGRAYPDAGAYADALTLAQRGEGVRLVPANQVKGRSFRHVFMHAVTAHGWPRDAPEHLPEKDHARWDAREQRLFALGVLAARESLTASASGESSPLLDAFTRAPASLAGGRPRR